MVVLRDRGAISRLEDPRLRALVEGWANALMEGLEGEYELGELALCVVVEPGDTLGAIEREVGFPVLRNRATDKRFGEPGFVPSFELCEEHSGWYEVVWIVSDDGFGVDLFVPKAPGVEPDLLAMCAHYAMRGTS